MSDLTKKMINDIKVDIPNVTANTVERYFDQTIRDFFYQTRRHRFNVLLPTTGNIGTVLSQNTINRNTTLDFNLDSLIGFDSATTDGKTIWGIDRTLNTIQRVDFNTKQPILTNIQPHNRDNATPILNSPTSILYNENKLLITDDQSNELIIINSVTFQLISRHPINDYSSGIAITSKNIFIGSSSPFENKVYVYSHIGIGQYDTITTEDRVSTISTLNDNLIVITGNGSNYENPKLSIYTDKVLKSTTAIDYFTSSPTAAFPFEDKSQKTLYLGRNNQFYAINAVGIALSPKNFDTVMVEKVIYTNPDNGIETRLSDTKDKYKDVRDNNSTKELTYYQPTNTTIEISHSVRGEIEAQVSLTPKDHTWTPDYIINEYYDGIKAGIMSLLYMLPQDWQSPDFATYYKEIFMRCVKVAQQHYVSNVDTFRPARGRENYGQRRQDILFINED